MLEQVAQRGRARGALERAARGGVPLGGRFEQALPLGNTVVATFIELRLMTDMRDQLLEL